MIDETAAGSSFAPDGAFRYSLALCFFFSFAESVLPHPVFFLRYGFANIALLMALSTLDMRRYFALVAWKSVLSSFLSANLFTPFFIVSFVANIIVFLLVFLLRNVRCVSFLGLSLLSSFSYNVIQALMLSRFVLGPFASKPLSVMLLVGNFSAVLTGCAANFLHAAYIRNATAACSGGIGLQCDAAGSKTACASQVQAFRCGFRPKMMLGFAFSLACVFVLNLFNPSGQVIWVWHSLRVTRGALSLSSRRTLFVFAGFAFSILFRLFARPGSGFMSQVMMMHSMFVTNFHIAGKCIGRKGFRGLFKRLEDSICIN